MPKPSRTQLILAFFFVSQAFSFAGVLLAPLLAASQKFANWQTGLILTLVTVAAGLGQPFMGRWLDMGRHRALLALIVCGYSLGIYAFIDAQHPAWLLLAGALGISLASTSLRTLTSTAILSPLSDSGRSDAIATRYLISNAAMACAAGLALWGLERFRSQLFIADWFTTLLLAGVCVFAMRRLPQRERSEEPTLSVWTMLREAWAQNGLLIAGIMIIGICFATHISYIPLLFNKLGLSPTEGNSTMLLTNTLLVIAGVPVARRLTRSWSAQRRGSVAVGFISVGFSLFPWVESRTILIGATIIWTIGEILFIPWEIETLYSCFDRNRVGFASGAVSLIFNANMMFSPLLSTFFVSCPRPLASALYFLLPVLGLFTTLSAQRARTLRLAVAEFK